MVPNLETLKTLSKYFYCSKSKLLSQSLHAIRDNEQSYLLQILVLMTKKRIKICTVGDSLCGKTSLIKRFCERRFDRRMTSTIGIDYGSIQFDVEEEIVSVDLFDSSGLDQFAEIRNEFYQNTDAFLLVFDVSNQQSFDRLQFWINEIKNRLMQEDWKQRIYVVGNKNDVVGRKVSPQQGMGFVEKHNLSNYFDTSALTGSYIDAMFEKVFEEASRS